MKETKRSSSLYLWFISKEMWKIYVIGWVLNQVFKFLDKEFGDKIINSYFKPDKKMVWPGLLIFLLLCLKIKSRKNMILWKHRAGKPLISIIIYVIILKNIYTYIYDRFYTFIEFLICSSLHVNHDILKTPGKTLKEL